MRAFFLLLVLANLGFFAWANFFTQTDTQSDPRPMARQIAPEKLRVVPPSALPKPTPLAPDPAAQNTSQTPNAAPVPAPAASEAPQAGANTCVEWGGFTPTDTARVTEALAPLALGARLSQRQIEENASWWVYIGPRATRQDAQKKAAELKALGVEEYFILQDEGPQRYALSLGVFKSAAAANNRLEALRERGVKTAQVGKRETPVQKVYFQIRPAEDSLVAKLRETARAFAGTDVRDCPAPAR